MEKEIFSGLDQQEKTQLWELEQKLMNRFVTMEDE